MNADAIAGLGTDKRAFYRGRATALTDAIKLIRTGGG